MRGTSFGIAVFVTGLMVAACDNQASQPPGGAADSVEQQEPEVVENACGLGKKAKCQCVSHPNDLYKGSYLGEGIEEAFSGVWDLEFGEPKVVDVDRERHQRFSYRLPLTFKSGFVYSCSTLEGITLHHTEAYTPLAKVLDANSPPVLVYVWFSLGGNPYAGDCPDLSEMDVWPDRNCTFQTDLVLRLAGRGDVTKFRILVLHYHGDSPYVDPDTGIYRRDFVFSSPSGR